MKVTFAKGLKPHEATASERDRRPALANVYLDPLGYLVATDGYVITAIPCAIEDIPEGFNGCILPMAVVKAASALREPMLAVDLQTRAASVIDAYGARIEGQLVDDFTFPAWAALVPHAFTPSVGYTVNPTYLTLLAKAFDKQPMTFLSSSADGDGPLFVKAGDCFAVLMPMFLARDAAIEFAENVTRPKVEAVA